MSPDRPAVLASAQGEPVFEDVPGIRPPLVLGDAASLTAVDRIVSAPAERKTSRLWWIGFVISAAVGAMGLAAWGYTFVTGIGVWNENQPLGWAFDITNFVFWIGIGHAGTLISAILFLFRQKWRTSINRFAEAMTIFAVIVAGMQVLGHTGRPWVAFYWLLPYPNQMQMWVNFKSPLIWDVFAVSTYFTISLVFWYVGLIPDLATLRDRAVAQGRKWAHFLYGLFALGWRGSARAWTHYESAYLILAGLSTPLVLSVHTIVSFDFAASILPGWHTTIFPPYFVAGAVFSGFGMVVTLMVIARQLFGLKDIVTLLHLEKMNKILLATGMMVGYAYAMEFFISWYSGNPFERFVFINRLFGPYAWAYWIMVSCNVLSPQVFWWRKARTSIPIMFAVSIFVNIGMWFERFTIVASSLHRDFLPSSWDYYRPSLVEVGILIGNFGVFMTLFLLFCRFLPVIAMSEVKGVLPNAHPHGMELAPAADVVTGVPTGTASPRPGRLARFDSPEALFAAIAALRRRGFTRLNAFTPYPVHGMEEALGIRRSRLPRVTLAFGLLGSLAAVGLIYWTSAVDYKIVIGGKPLFALPPSIPIMFELTVLFGGLATVAAMLFTNKLPTYHSPLSASPHGLSATQDGFVLTVQGDDPRFDRAQFEQEARAAGAVAVVELADSPGVRAALSGQAVSAEASS